MCFFSSARARAYWVLGFLAMVALADRAKAHEINPAVVDLTIGAERVELEARVQLEALLAGVDLDRYANTNDAPEAEEYDALRALPPAELETIARARFADMASAIDLRAGDVRLEPELGGVDIPEIGDLENPRASVLEIVAERTAEGPITFGWAQDWGAAAVRQQGAGEEGYTGFLLGGERSAEMTAAGGAVEPLRAFVDYVAIGFEHILPKGLDHILFVLGLFFFALAWKPLLLQVTAFTLAHTITLALATLGIVSVSPSIVEPLIALSIAVVALENLFAREAKWWRILVIFGFGLLHGLGFASVLGEIGLEPGRFALSLIAFNIGVELGQLTVIAIAFVLLGWPFGHRADYRERIATPASILIALVGSYWFVERIWS